MIIGRFGSRSIGRKKTPPKRGLDSQHFLISNHRNGICKFGAPVQGHNMCDPPVAPKVSSGPLIE